MSQRPRRNATKHLSEDVKTSISKAFSSSPLLPASREDKKEWEGFCEVDSEPAYFNSMLRDFGVNGVKVQEVVSLDKELLTLLPQPVHGLVFLFKWREEDPDKLEQSCPEGVWFANQTVPNACASVALLNIVNNIPSVELGQHLQQFKDFTKEFTPALRGDAISNFAFVKETHNSYARKMDMLNSDLHMRNEVTAKKQSKKPPLANEYIDAGFHFIAYVPINGHVWKLDGLERQPQRLGSIKSNDWVERAKPDIEARMSEYEQGQIEFSILSLVRDPLLTLIPTLAENVRGLQVLATHLESLKADERDGDSAEDREGCLSEETVTGPEPKLGLAADLIERAEVPSPVQEVLRTQVLSEIFSCQQELCSAQARLRASVRDELEATRCDEEKATARRHDYGPLALKLAQVLARKPIPGYQKFQSKKKRQKKK